MNACSIVIRHPDGRPLEEAVAIAHTQKFLVDGILRLRTKNNLTNEDFDRTCGFGAMLPTEVPRLNRKSTPLPLPSSKEFESNPKLMNSSIVARAFSAFDIKIDEVFDFDTTDEVASKFLKNAPPIAAGNGWGSDEALNEHRLAKMFIIHSALDEIDSACLQTYQRGAIER